jgi:pyruvate carboxylase
MLNPSKKYNLEYYLGVVDKIVAMGAHILGIKVFGTLLQAHNWNTELTYTL